MKLLAIAAALLSVHAMVNARLLRTASSDPPETPLEVAVLLPARDEAGTITAAIAGIRAQRGVPHLQILVLDDCSTDETAALAQAAADDDGRIQLLAGAPPPPGWLGKPHACAALAQAAGAADVLVFVDADVALEPGAVAAAVDLLTALDADLVCPFPRQLAIGLSERLVQPLLPWSWLSLLPLRAAERSARPSMVAVTGQFLAVRRRAYETAGGHGGVRGAVLEDLSLARAVRRTGGRVILADGSGVASCRMYDGWPGVRDGYGKSLWSAFGSPAGAVAVVGVLTAVYVVPAVAALRGSPLGAAGYLAGVTGRVITARRTGGRVWPDAFWHPASVLVADWLTLWSLWHRRHGQVTWKGRPV